MSHLIRQPHPRPKRRTRTRALTSLLSPRRALSPLPQLTVNCLAARSPGGGFRGRATDTECKRAAAVASTSDQLVCWLSQRNESTQISPRPNSLRRTQSTVIRGLTGSLPLPPPGIAPRDLVAIDGRGNFGRRASETAISMRSEMCGTLGGIQGEGGQNRR